jgi:hypothetical protein
MTIGPDEGPASLFPSTIDMDGVAGRVTSVRVTLTDLDHSWASDLNIGLQSPDGRTVALMAGCRGDNTSSDDVTGTLTFADDGEVLSDDMEDHVLGPERTPRVNAVRFLRRRRATVPVRAGPRLARWRGPNGAWSLYVYDDEDEDGGSLAG